MDFTGVRSNSYDDAETLSEFDLIVPIWTMGVLTDERAENASTAVALGDSRVQISRDSRVDRRPPRVSEFSRE